MAPGNRAPKIVRVTKEYAFNVSTSGSAKSGDRISVTVTPEGCEDGQGSFTVTVTVPEYGMMCAEIADQGWTRVPTGKRGTVSR